MLKRHLNYVILVLLIVPFRIFAQPSFPVTVIQDKNSTSPYATTENLFSPYNTYGAGQQLNGQCTWYVYGRVIELIDNGYIIESVETNMYNAFDQYGGRYALNWDTLLEPISSWHSTANTSLPYNERKAGKIVMWDYGQLGHVAFVEEVSPDRSQYRISEFNWAIPEGYSNSVWLPFDGDDQRGTGVYPKFYDLGLVDNNTPALYEPPNEAQFYLGENNILFDWSDIAGATYYEIWIDNHEGFGSPEVGFDNGQSQYWVDDGIVSSSQFYLTVAMQNQLPQNPYCWKVRAQDSNHNAITDWSETRNVTLLIIPILYEPPNGSMFYLGVNDILFNWSDVVGAPYYEIWIDNNEGFGSPEVGYDNGQSQHWVDDGIILSSQFYLTVTMQNQLPSDLYHWKARGVDSNKNAVSEWSDIREVILEIIAVDENNIDYHNTQLIGNLPNPFYSSTSIQYYLCESGLVQIEIFNIKGQKVVSLINDIQESGIKLVNWNGLDNQGNIVGPGFYFYRLLLNGKFQNVKKCVLLDTN